MSLWNRFNTGAAATTGLGADYFQVFPLAFNTASITAGIQLVTLPAKLMLESLDVFVTGFFDGTTPSIYFGWQQTDAKGSGTPFASASLASGDTPLTPGFAFQANHAGNLGGKPVYTPTNHTQVLWAGITSATGTDPANTKGTCQVILRGRYWSI